MLMGKDLKTGRLEIAEYDGQTPGQMSLFDEPEDGEDLIDELEQLQTDKPLDLRERGKQQKGPEQLKTGGHTEDGRGTTGGLFVSINSRKAGDRGH